MFGIYPVIGNQAVCFRKNWSLFVNNTSYPSVSLIYFVIVGVINPNSTAQTDSFFFQTFDSSGRVICQSYNNFSYTATPGNLGILGNMSRNAFVAGTPFNLTTQINTTDDFPSGGFVTLFIPLEQGILANNTPKCQVLFNSVLLTPSCFAVNLTTGAQIWINEWCSNGSAVCSKGMNAMIFINYTMINPYFITQNVKLFCFFLILNK